MEYANLKIVILNLTDHPTNKQIERIDEIITSVLINAVKSTQGMKRNILFSKHEQMVRVAKLHWKDIVKELKGLIVNYEKIGKRKQSGMIEEINDKFLLEQVKEILNTEEIK